MGGNKIVSKCHYFVSELWTTKEKPFWSGNFIVGLILALLLGLLICLPAFIFLSVLKIIGAKVKATAKEIIDTVTILMASNINIYKSSNIFLVSAKRSLDPNTTTITGSPNPETLNTEIKLLSASGSLKGSPTALSCLRTAGTPSPPILRPSSRSPQN